MSEEKKNEETGISEVMMAIADLCIALGEAPVNTHEPMWEHQVDEEWFVAVNGHRNLRECSKGPKVEPFCAYVEFNGWPAGIVSPAGGSFAAGAAANEDTFLEALRAKIEKVKEGS